MIIHQFNQTSPQLFEANRTQVNINIVPATKTTMGGEVNGYEYDTVVVENAYMYSDNGLELLAKLTYAKQYLVDTAWYIERFNDPSSGKAIPQEILDGRAQARVTINELEVV